MTREHAKELFYFSAYDKHDVYEAVNKIYDDFESMVCDNCKYVTEFPSGMICQRGFNDGYSPLFEVSVFSDFGCNKFERKKD